MIVLAGEALIDLAPRDGLLLPLAGGSPANVAVGLGRLDVPARFVGRLSHDRFGALLTARLREAGVDVSAAPRTHDPTTLAVVHLDDHGRASYGFYLDGTSAPGLTADELPDTDDADLVHVSLGAVSLATEPAGASLRALLRRGAGRVTRSLDPNVRPDVIADLPAYAREVAGLVGEVDLVKVSDEDLRLLHPDRTADAVAGAWARSGPGLVVCTRGPQGATAWTGDGSVVTVPGEPVAVVDTVGAGDAFTSGLLAWLHDHGRLAPAALRSLSTAEVAAALRFAGHVAAVTCTRPGGDPPTRAELTGASDAP